MTDYIVKGARKDTGETVEIQIAAASAEAASEQANTQGILVERVRVFDVKAAIGKTPRTERKPRKRSLLGLRMLAVVLDLWLWLMMLAMFLLITAAIAESASPSILELTLIANLISAFLFLSLLARLFVGFHLEWRKAQSR